ncbi:MFS general substrate transporter [Aspergillus japonicus CBS 114.51]|uniref:MFS general substrate transporter n=2 Tax=Aspergillus TaxID=5052 RepID=A0A2V5HCH5_ASPV1|nr:MFS general substrate transporter [Aspergillus japonicus CBS 114.51]PYI20102.1 MFS general substrate transporter [Aspergillus violaceofuscus CBS 115571]RAH77692.1 MFS general substrate transporter [Aspergillus japonicus CBS 114.51]
MTTTMTTLSAKPSESQPLQSTSPLSEQSSYPDDAAASDYRFKADQLNRAIQEIGMGRYQWQLFGVIGFGWASDNLWPIVTSLILVPVSYEFHVGQPPLLSLAQNIGLLAGSLFWGFTCDVFGRRWAFNMTIAITAIFGLIAAGSPTFAAVGVFTALWSFGVGGNLPVDSAIFLEFLPGSHQYLLTVLSLNWALAQVLANLVAWPLIGNMTCASAANCTKSANMGWRYFLLTMGGIALVMCIARCVFFTLYESPKYLMGKGLYEESVTVIHEVARRNGKTTTLSIDDLTDEDGGDRSLFANDNNDNATPIPQQQQQPAPARPDQHHPLRLADHLRARLSLLSLTSLKALFASRQRARTTILMILIWALIGLGFPLYNAFLPYLQQTRGVQFGDGSTYLTYRNSLIISAVGVPGSLVGGIMVEIPRLGRKGTLAVGAGCTGAFLLASTTAHSSAALLGWNCAYSFTSSLLYAVLYAYTPEIFETQYRGTGNALVGGANRIGGILAPVIAIVAGIQTSVPVYISGGMFVLAGLLVLWVPVETRGKMSL